MINNQKQIKERWLFHYAEPKIKGAGYLHLSSYIQQLLPKRIIILTNINLLN